MDEQTVSAPEETTGMQSTQTPPEAATPCNIAQPLAEMAAKNPFRQAMVFPAGRDDAGRARNVQFNFWQLNELVDSYAHGLSDYGIQRGDRTLGHG